VQSVHRDQKLPEKVATRPENTRSRSLFASLHVIFGRDKSRENRENLGLNVR
jgi:hypothetical protein